MNVHRGRLAQEAVHRREIQVFPPIVYQRPPKDHLRNVFRPNKLSDRIRDASSFQANYFRPQAFREPQVGAQSVLIRFLLAKFPVHMHDVQLGVHAPSHPRAPGN